MKYHFRVGVGDPNAYFYPKPNSMKRIRIFLPVLLILASCGGPKPEKVAEQYLLALKNKNWEEAKKLGTDETKKKIDALKSFDFTGTSETGIEEVKDIKCTVKDNYAECTFCCTNKGEDKLSLVKKEGKWLVNDLKEAGDLSPDKDTDREEEAPLTDLPNTPVEVATAYLKALQHGDWERAKQLGTVETAGKVNGAKGFGGDLGIEKVEDVKCTEDGDYADCTFCCMKDGNNTVKLVRRNGQWLVNDPKETDERVNAQ